jgi:pilus assembly protein Flp/PilA
MSPRATGATVVVNHGQQGFRRVTRAAWPRTRLQARERVNQEWRMSALMRIIQCQKGANAIEYALVASLIAIAAIVAMGNLGSKIDTMFNNVSSVM